MKKKVSVLLEGLRYDSMTNSIIIYSLLIIPIILVGSRATGYRKKNRTPLVGRRGQKSIKDEELEESCHSIMAITRHLMSFCVMLGWGPMGNKLQWAVTRYLLVQISEENNHFA